MKFEIWQLFVFIFVVALLCASFANIERYPHLAMIMYASCVCGIMLFVSNGLRNNHIANGTQGAGLFFQKIFELVLFGFPTCLAAGFVLTSLIGLTVDLLFGTSILNPSEEDNHTATRLFFRSSVVVGLAYLYWQFKPFWSSRLSPNR